LALKRIIQKVSPGHRQVRVLEQEQTLQARLLHRESQIGNPDAIVGERCYNTYVHAADLALKWLPAAAKHPAIVAARALEVSQVLSCANPAVLSSTRRQIAPVPTARHKTEMTTPVALAAPGAFGALIVIGHFDLAPVVPFKRATKS
jgi:hypothetical protein